MSHVESAHDVVLILKTISVTKMIMNRYIHHEKEDRGEVGLVLGVCVAGEGAG